MTDEQIINEPTKQSDSATDKGLLPTEKQQQLVSDSLNATEAHLLTQPHIPEVLRRAILQAESNCRANGGDVMNVATIDHGRVTIPVQEGLQQHTLCSFLWDCLERTGGKSIHFAFANDDDQLCVLYLCRDEDYMAVAPIEREGTAVTLGDWEIQPMEKR